MAVFKPVLNWTTYQEKQLKALESIEDTLKESINLDKRSQRNIESISDTIYTATNILLSGIDAIWNDRELPNILNNIQDLQERQLNASIETAEELLEQMEDLGDDEDPDPNEPDPEELAEEFKDFLNEKLEKLIDSTIASTETWTELYNQTIQMTGSNMEESQEFRRAIVNQVSDLNKDVRRYYNPQKALETMVSISNSTDISNRETLEEISTPILLAQETTNLSIDSLAETFGKFYNRYGFTAAEMEGLVDHLRNTSKDKDVSEAALQQALAKSENRLAIKANGDKDVLEKLSKELTTSVAYLQANYIEETPYVEDLYTFLSEEITENHEMAKKYSNYGEISELVNSGKYTEAMESMVRTIAGYSPEVSKHGWGISMETWDDAKAAVINDLQSAQEFQNSIDTSQSSRDAVEDKFVSWSDQIFNKFTEATSYLGTIQETLGIGFADIYGIYAIGKDILPFLKPGGGLTQLLSGTTGALNGTPGGILGSLRGVGGSLTKLLPAMGVIGGAVGIYKVVEGVYSILEEEYDSAGDPYQDALKAKESAEYGYGLVGTYNKDTGKTDWSYKALTKEQAANYNSDEYADSYAESAWKDESFWTKLTYALTTNLPGDPYGKDYYKSFVKGTYEDIQDILDSNREIYNFYAERNLLTDRGEIEHFANNIDKYAQYYEEGIYQGENNKWYRIIDDSEVPKSEAPKKFDVGTNLVTEDQLAYIHENEAIVPAEYNPAANMNELERLRAESESRKSEDNSEVVAVLSEIRSFMEYWKNSNTQQDAINNIKSKNSEKLEILRRMIPDVGGV